MPPSRALVWHAAGAKELADCIGRRKDQAGFRNCVEQHLLTVAGDLDLAKRYDGPANLRLYTWKCQDGEVGVRMRAVLEEQSDGSLAVLSCGTIAY